MTEFESQFKKAEESFHEKKYLHAIQIYQSLLNVPEYKRKSLIKLIEIYDLQNQLDSAVKLFENYLSENEDDENVRTYFAQFLIRHKMYSDAHDILSGVSIKSHPEKNFLMGIVNYCLDDYEVAILNFKEFISMNSNSELLPEAHLYKAKCFIKFNELDSALNQLKKAVDLSTRNYEVYLTLAIVYYLKEMYFHALESIQKSIRFNSTDPENYKWTGKILFKLGELKKARSEFETLTNLSKPDPEVYTLLGLCCAGVNDSESARHYFKLALELDPANEIAAGGISDCNYNLTKKG